MWSRVYSCLLKFRCQTSDELNTRENTAPSGKTTKKECIWSNPQSAKRGSRRDADGRTGAWRGGENPPRGEPRHSCWRQGFCFFAIYEEKEVEVEPPSTADLAHGAVRCNEGTQAPRVSRAQRRANSRRARRPPDVIHTEECSDDLCSSAAPRPPASAAAAAAQPTWHMGSAASTTSE